MNEPLDRALLDALTAIASAAARVVLDLRASGQMAKTKQDGSPVTAADLAAQEVLLAGLRRLLPELAVVSEEAAAPQGPLPARFALVDPLDGTKEFVAGRDEFAINLAIVEAGTPVLGIVSAPARGLVWRGLTQENFADRLQLAPGDGPERASAAVVIHTRARPKAGITAVTSRSHLDPDTKALLARMATAERIACGSALKFGLVAEGSADIYPRLGPTCEWDIAAGHAVVAAAGGCVTAPDGTPLRYGNAAQRFHVPGFIACGDRTLL